MEREIEEIATQILNKQRIKKLTKNWSIELTKESKEFILNAATTISNSKNIKVEPINSTLKNNIILYCSELSFRVISPDRFLNIERMNIISSYDENEIALFEDACREYNEKTLKNSLSLDIKLL